MFNPKEQIAGLDIQINVCNSYGTYKALFASQSVNFYYFDKIFRFYPYATIEKGKN